MTEQEKEFMQYDPQCYELCIRIEDLPASEIQTRISILANNLHHRVRNDRQKMADQLTLISLMLDIVEEDPNPSTFKTICIEKAKSMLGKA